MTENKEKMLTGSFGLVRLAVRLPIGLLKKHRPVRTRTIIAVLNY
jgi:hypothetical protein